MNNKSGPTLKNTVCDTGRGEGVLLKILGRGVRPASQNPYPIYDQDFRFSQPYLWPKSSIFPTLFMPYLGPGQRFDTLFMTWDPISYQSWGKMAKFDTLFMTKRLKKHTLWATHTYIAHKSPPPLGCERNRNLQVSRLLLYQFLDRGAENTVKYTCGYFHLGNFTANSFNYTPGN